MFGKHFALTDETMNIMEELGRHMPGGFFIYRAEGDEELLYANMATVRIFGCEDLEEFKKLAKTNFANYKEVLESLS